MATLVVTAYTHVPEKTQNSECFIVEGHLTHYKWYDYKHAHTTYTKQLTNNTKQTDKTKRSRKKRNKHEQKEKKRKQYNKNKNQQQQQQKQKKLQIIHDVDDIQVIIQTKHCRIWYSSAY